MNLHLLVILLIGALLYNLIAILLISHLYSRGLSNKSIDRVKQMLITAKLIKKIGVRGIVINIVLLFSLILMPVNNKEIPIAGIIFLLMTGMSCYYTHKRVEVMATKELNKRTIKEEE